MAAFARRARTRKERVNLNESNPNSRVDVLDSLRAFALSGILVINAMSILAVTGSTPAFTVKIPAGERALQDLILFAVESKFFTLFSLLFGVSFAIQIGSAKRQGVAFLPRISRRLATLLLFGLAHIFFLWDGDILVIYALSGALLVTMRHLSDRAIRRWIVSLLAAPASLVLVGFIWTLAARLTPAGAKSLAASDATIVSSFADTTATQELLKATWLGGGVARLHTYLELLPLLLSRIPTVLAMFLLGLAIGRGDFLGAIGEKSGVLKVVAVRALISGAAVMGLILAATKFLPPTSALIAIIEDQYIAGPLLCIGYASAFVLAHRARPDARFFRVLMPMGRMALTNYLLQSLVLAWVSYGWGLGLALSLNGYQVLVLSVGLFCAQLLLSRVWLSAFHYGPCEWLWRCATYRRWMALRLR